MATSPYRSTVTIDGTKFDAVSTSVAFSTLKDRSGNPEMGSLKTDIRVFVDFHDDGNVPYSTLSKLFNMANVVTRDKIKDVKIEYWKDETKQDALASYTFKGWISRFETQNPTATTAAGSNGTDLSSYSTINHLLILDIEPALDSNNFASVSLSN
jgi:hypothetical protein